MSYETIINDQRVLRENLIRDFQKENGEEETNSFTYFPVDEKWRVSAEITIRKPKEGLKDHKLTFTRIGKLGFSLQDIAHKFDLYQIENEPDDKYIYLKDGTSGKNSYGVGRFVQVVKDGGKTFVDFNLAFTPACGHLTASACPWARESSTISIEAGEKSVEKDE